MSGCMQASVSVAAAYDCAGATSEIGVSGLQSMGTHQQLRYPLHSMRQSGGTPFQKAMWYVPSTLQSASVHSATRR